MNMDCVNGLQKQKKLYCKLAIAFTVTLAAYALLAVYAQSQEESLTKLRRIKTNLNNMRDADIATRQTLTSFRALLPPGYDTISPEQLIFSRVDDIKLRFKNADMTINAIEDRPEEICLPFILKAVNPGYGEFLSALGQMEASVLPLVDIRTIAVSQGNEGETPVVTAIVEGLVKMPKVQRQ